MFRTVTVHPQELLCRDCMCRLWYVVRDALPDTSRWYNYIVYLVGLYIYYKNDTWTLQCHYYYYYWNRDSSVGIANR